MSGSGRPGSGSQPPNLVLVAETSDVRAFARLLRGIGLKHNAVMTISQAGFEVTVEEVRTLCAIAWIPTNLFGNFEFHELPSGEPACFEISLDALLQCLNIFGNAGPSIAGNIIPAMGRSKRRWAGDDEEGVGGSGGGGEERGRGRDRRTSMRMIWHGPGHPLSIFLHDDSKGPTTKCELSPLEPDELMNQEFNSNDCILYVIMKSEWFRDALLDLPPSCTRITLTATPRNTVKPNSVPDATGSSNARRTHRADVGQFSLKAVGDFGQTELDYPNDKEVMDKFDCEEPVTFSYHSSHFALLSRALNQSIKICIQVESSGFLCVQVMMPVADGVPLGEHSGILEFKMHALEDEG